MKKTAVGLNLNENVSTKCFTNSIQLGILEILYTTEYIFSKGLDLDIYFCIYLQEFYLMVFHCFFTMFHLQYSTYLQ